MNLRFVLLILVLKSLVPTNICCSTLSLTTHTQHTPTPRITIHSHQIYLFPAYQKLLLFSHQQPLSPAFVYSSSIRTIWIVHPPYFDSSPSYTRTSYIVLSLTPRQNLMILLFGSYKTLSIHIMHASISTSSPLLSLSSSSDLSPFSS